MSIFRLPCWVSKRIDRLRRDFLGSGPDLRSGRRLVCWKNLCRPRDHGGWGILDLSAFNLTLLGKWWWKLSANPDWCVAKVIQFNYRVCSWN